MKKNQKNTQGDKKESSINLESTVKIVGALGAVGMLVYSVYSYLDTRALEAKRPLLEVQFELYREAVAVSGRLSTVECAVEDVECIETYEKDCQRFRGLYWGGLAVVEDIQVEWAMVKFREALIMEHPALCAPQSIKKIATMPKSDKKEEGGNLLRASLDLAHCVNASLENSWDIELLSHECKHSVSPTLWDRIFGDVEKD